MSLTIVDVEFFTIGNLGGRTLVIYMKEKNVHDSSKSRIYIC